MNFSFEKKQLKHLYLTYTLAFLLVSFFVYGTYLITGHALIWHLDGANQHLPLLEQYRELVLNFFKDPSQGITQWAWNFGLGSDAFQVYSYYNIGDIFTYIALLFPKSQLALAFQLTIILRLYCAGLAFCYLAKHFDFGRLTIVAGALVYLFNAFLLYSNVAQPFFTTPFILFPLIIVALEAVLQKRSYLPLILVFTWMLISSFYFAYVLGIGAMLYLVLRFWTHYRRLYQPKDIFRVIFNLGLVTLTSLLCASIMLIPEILAVKNSTRSGGAFANGLTLYPPYYYLALPSQLINGANRDFYFWSALGFASLAFFALVYIVCERKKYPLLFWSFLVSFIMLLFPFFGAVFNGMLAPSNRWTLLTCLPMALAVCCLIKNSHQLTQKTLKSFTYSLLIYVAYIGVTYLFQNDEKLFIPVVFLFIFWSILIASNMPKIRSKLPAHLLLWALIANVCFNAIYFEAPYNGGYATEMLPAGAYKTLKNERFFGLDKALPDPQTDFYRISTLSKNYELGSDYHLYNVLGSKLYSINSYYSLQTKALGDFSNVMQNSQYEANIPLGQVSDRTVLNNFLGVRYLFALLNQPNANKIPYGYELAKTTQKITDPNGNSKKDQQTLLYQTKNAFPLLYLQSKAIATSTADKLNPTQRERALALGVVVDDKLAKNYPTTTVASEVVEVPYRLISSRGTVISPQDLVKQDSDETYQIVLEEPEKYGAGELHFDFSQIKYTPFTFSEQLALEKRKQINDLTQGILAKNELLSSYKYFRYHILQGSPDNSFSLSVTSDLGQEKLFQPKQNALSFYKTVTQGTLNSGYFKELPASLTLTPSKLGTYSFKLKIYVEKLGTSYDKQVQQLQKQALQDVKLTQNGVSGNITATKKGILTSSIPYSKGWEVTVDGKKRTVIKTNHAFIGTTLTKGKHHVSFTYHLPGLKLGALLSALGLLLYASLGLFVFLKNKKATKTV